MQENKQGNKNLSIIVVVVVFILVIAGVVAAFYYFSDVFKKSEEKMAIVNFNQSKRANQNQLANLNLNKNENQAENTNRNVNESNFNTNTEAAYPGWNLYTNSDYSYQLYYPNNVEVDENIEMQQGTKYPNKICVSFYYQVDQIHLGYVQISTPDNKDFSQVICGRTGIGYEAEEVSESLTIDGKEYIAKGNEEKGPGETLNYHNETLILNLDDGTRIEFGSGSDETKTYADYLEIKDNLIKMVESYQGI